MLTADLSVLGGYHIRKGYHPDSIFSQFHLHEAVRLAGTSNTSGGKNGHTLCIGVGVGVVPASLRRLGCIVDAIEIDPIVARFATTYFALQTPVIVQDARHFVNIASDHTYDYVIHDVFTGGDASYALFTESFFRDVRRIMRPNGVLALNFVAEMKGNENNMGAAIVALIYDRLQTVFGFVRLFSDGVDGHIHNFVLFASATKEGVMFRTPVERDSLGSDMRLSVLREFEKDEVFRRDLGSSKGVAVWQRGVWRIAAVHRRLMSEIHSKQLWPALLAAEHIA